MIRFEDVYRTVSKYHPDADLEMLRRAYIFSAREHKDQVRKSGEPYLIHPLSVASILAIVLWMASNCIRMAESRSRRVASFPLTQI